MRQEGHATINRVLHQQQEPASPSVARRLQIAEGAPVMRLSRLRIVDNDPLMIETSFLSLQCFPDLLHDDFAIRSLYDVISARYGIAVAELDQTLEPVLMTEYEADLLDSSAGSPAMLLEVIAYDGQDQPFEFSKAVVRGDKCQYYFRMRAVQ
jgi:GntR family transcriptional regulator